MSSATTRFNCKNLAFNKSQTIIEAGSSVSLVHRSGDPPTVNRIIASISGFDVELLPSKGFSVGQVYLNGQPKFWDPPIGICDPDDLNLFSDEIAINGTPAPGFTFLKTFCGGIEFYGLRNWGMPVSDEKTGFNHPIHGETSNIPVDLCDVEINDREIILSASFIYRKMSDNSNGIWYLQGSELFEVTRRVIIRKDKEQIILIDKIKNISNKSLRPDWGYHVTFMPTDGSRLLVPSSTVENRSGEKVPDNFDKWTPANNNAVREEIGIIHKGLKTVSSEMGDLAYVLVVHPGQSGIKVSFPATPYFQTWFCKGGANSPEFTTVDGGKPLFSKNWDGIGIEIGSSALDHNGNTEPVVAKPASLQPDEAITIRLKLEFPDRKDTDKISKEIMSFNKNRTIH